MPITFFLEKVVGFFQSAKPTHILGRTAMNFEEELIYSKRYPPAEEELEKFSADPTLPVITSEQRETSYRKFCARMNSEPRLEPIPGQEEKAREFIALAKKFSEEHEVDVDISRLPHSVNVSLHLYCSAFSKGMTRQFAQLLNMCDNLSSFMPKSEPSDFTLILEVHTHKFYLSDIVMNEF